MFVGRGKIRIGVLRRGVCMFAGTRELRSSGAYLRRRSRAPRKSEKQVITVVSCGWEEPSDTPEKRKASHLRGELPVGREVVHPGKTKSKSFQR